MGLTEILLKYLFFATPAWDCSAQNRKNLKVMLFKHIETRSDKKPRATGGAAMRLVFL